MAFLFRVGFCRGVLSIVIVFHLMAVALVPYAENSFSQLLKPVLVPYLSFLGLAGRWGFFAPEPGAGPMYIQFETLDEVGNSLLKSTWVDEGAPYFFKDRKYRWTTSGFMMLSAEGAAEKLLMPYLCHKYPLAASARIWSVTHSNPGIAAVLSGQRKPGDSESGTHRLLTQAFCADFRRGGP